MVYSAAYTKRRELLNPDSPIKIIEEEGLDEEEEGGGGEVGEISVLGQLCEKFNGEWVWSKVWLLLYRATQNDNGN